MGNKAGKGKNTAAVLGASLLRILAGFSLGVFLGGILGLLTAFCRPLRVLAA